MIQQNYLSFDKSFSLFSFSPLYSLTKYNGLFFVSLNILPKYSPTIPNNIICIPEKNKINKIVAWKAWIGWCTINDLAITYIKYTNKIKNVGIAIKVEILSGEVVKDVIPSIARLINLE